MKTEEIDIRIATTKDFDLVMQVEKEAFGEDDEANLVADLLQDKSAEPSLSLLAFYKNEAVGHVLFTRCTVEDEKMPVAHLLAPLAVRPNFQNLGIGGQLMKTGFTILQEQGTELVFVLGHKTYYPRHGFIADAEKLGFIPPYPIPEKDADAWMVNPLSQDALTKFTGKVSVADMLMKPEYWVE